MLFANILKVYKMTSAYRISVLMILMLFSFSGADGELIPDLTLNYSDFSYISSIAVGYQYVYFGTTHGVVRYDITRDKWDLPLSGIAGLGDLQIYEVKASFDDQRVWVRTDLGIYEYNEVMKSWEPVDEMPQVDTRARHLSPDPFYFAPWGYNYMPDGVLVDDIGRRFPLTDIVDDSWTNLWIGTWGLGAARADESNRRIELLIYGILQEDITTLHLDSGILWMSGRVGDSYRTGVTIFDSDSNSFSYIESLDNLEFITENVNDIHSNEIDVFAATDNGIWVIDKEKREIRERLTRRSGLPDNRVLSVFVTGDTLFAGTEYGLGILSAYSDSSEQVVQVVLPSLTIHCLEMAENALWIGTNYGVFRMNLGNRKMGHLSAPEITGSGRIFDIEYTGGRIWLADEFELASINLQTADIVLFPEVGNYGGVTSVAVRDTIVAAATGNGLLLIYEGEKPRHQLYTVGDGLISNDIRDLVFDEEYLWLGTDRGLTRFWYQNPAL